MKFSIIVPVYNTEKYLPQCLDSIINQTYKDLDVVLVDDGSLDNSGSICDEYAKKDKRIKVIHKRNNGQASARNDGIKMASGEYLCFLDSDDFWSDNEVLSKISKKISEDNPDILELNYKFYFEKSGRELSLGAVDFTGFSELANDRRIEFLVNCGRLNPAAWGMCVSRAFLEKNQVYFLENIVSEDIDWCIRLYSFAPKVNVLEEAVYVYRKDREGATTGNIRYKNINDLCSVIERAPEVLCDKNNYVHQVMMNYVMYQVAIACALVHLNGTGISKGQKASINNRLKSFCKKYLSQYHTHPKVKKAYIVYKFFGYKIMSWVLGFYLNHRGR